jgi:ribosome maturation factor RimP
VAKKTQTEQQKRPEIPADDLQKEVEERLAVTEPDVEVLMVETTGIRGSRGLRVYLDRPAGVDHDLCARVTRHLRDLLANYTVEVSSPGPARPLTKPDHYRRFVGRPARVRTLEAIAGRSDFKGELVGADERGVTLAGELGTVTIPHERIRRANLVPQTTEVPRSR